MKQALSYSNIYFVLFATIFLAAVGLAAYTDEYLFILIPAACLLLFACWLFPDNLFFLLLASIPFSTEFQWSSALGTDLPDELLMIIASILFLFYLVYHKKLFTFDTWSHPLLLLLLLGIGWAMISAVFSLQPLLSLKFLMAKCWYLGAFVLAALILFRHKRGLEVSIRVFTISMLTVTVITLVRHAFFGFSFSHINDSLIPFFRNHVNYSALLVCVFPIIYLFRQSAQQRRVRLFANCLLLMIIAALFLSYARGAWLALLMGLLAGWLLRRRLLWKAYILAIVCLLIAVAWLQSGDRFLRYAHDYRTTIFHQDFREHLVATYRFKDVSTAERFNRWVAACRMIGERGLTGFGPNTFYPAYKPYTIPVFRTWVSNNPERSTVHNYFLLLAVEQGWPGLLLFLVLAGAVLFYAQRVYQEAIDPFYRRVALGVGMIYVMLLTVNFLSDLVETDKIGSIFFLCISAIIAADVAGRRAKDMGRIIQSDPATDV